MAKWKARAGLPWARGVPVIFTFCALSPQGIRTVCAAQKTACGSCCPQLGWPSGLTGAAGWRVTCGTWKRWGCPRRCRHGHWCCSYGPHRWAWVCVQVWDAQVGLGVCAGVGCTGGHGCVCRCGMHRWACQCACVSKGAPGLCVVCEHLPM
jgi:hypothetical protein